MAMISGNSYQKQLIFSSAYDFVRKSLKWRDRQQVVESIFNVFVL